jgi:hypothetical protein
VTATELRRVAQSEYDLLTVARSIVGEGSFATIDPIVHIGRKLPDKVGPTAMRLLEETLARGVVLELARRGGWRPMQHVSGPGPTAQPARLWERHAAPPPIPFSPRSLKVLRFLSSGQKGELPAELPLSLGDELTIYLALDLLHSGSAAQTLAEQPLVRASRLAWLGFYDVLVRHEMPQRGLLDPSAFAPFVTGPGAIVLEALQQDLARRTLEVERGKKEIRKLETMTSLGAVQGETLGSFMDAADKAGRRDLAGFLLEAGAKLLARPVPPSAWIERLELIGALSAKTAGARAAGALLRVLGRWQKWDEDHRSVRFIDDGYDASQLLLRKYEQLGDRYRHGEDVLRALDSLTAAADVAAEPEGKKA